MAHCRAQRARRVQRVQLARRARRVTPAHRGRRESRASKAAGPAGPQGEQGIQGVSGADGKSAYTSAAEGGYTGTETAFNQALAAVPNKADKKVPAAAGNLAALDANGNLADSGKKSADFANASHVTDAVST